MFRARIRLYSDLAKKAENLGELHFHLTQLILRTEENAAPGPYHCQKSPLVITDAVEYTAVRGLLASYEGGMVPAFMNVLGGYMARAKSQ